MVTVYFHGALGASVNREWRLEAESVAEIIQAVELSTQKLFDYLMRADERGVGYRVLVGKNNELSHESQLRDRFDPEKVEEVHFYPASAGGSKAGLFQIFLGVVLIAAAIMSAGASASFTFSGLGKVIAAGGAKGFFASMGVSMVLGGVTSLVVGQPKNPGMGESAENKGSYIMNGVVNTSRQGGPIPLGYGELIIGSQIVSVSVKTRRIASDYAGGITDSDAGTNQPGVGGSGGSGTNPFPSAYPYYQPITWNRLPETDPVPTSNPE